MEVTQCVLVKQSKSRKGFGDRGNTILAVSIDGSHSWSFLVVLLCTVVLGPQSSIGRSHLDGERRAGSKILVNLLYLIRNSRECRCWDPWSGLYVATVNDVNEALATEQLPTLSHCGTGNAGEGSKHLANTKAGLASIMTRLIKVLAIVDC